jgi:hypothetical protein
MSRGIDSTAGTKSQKTNLQQKSTFGRYSLAIICVRVTPTPGKD